MNSFFSSICKIFLKPVVDKYLIKEVQGLENVPVGNFILAANHQSHLDWIASAYPCVPRRFTYLGQVDKYTGFAGLERNLLYFIADVIPINRKDEESKKTALLETIKRLKGGDIVVIYPEGTRSRNGQLQKGKLGIAKIFLETGVPILPMGIRGTFDILPPGRVFPRIKKNVEINIGRPLYFEKELKAAQNLNPESQEYKNLCQQIVDKVMEEIIKLIG